MIAIIFIDYNFISKISPILYGLILIALIAVLFTPSNHGATSWFTIGSISLQPAEFAKVIVIITLATYMSRIQEKGKDQISRPTRLLVALAIVMVPVLLIIKQPDYGTAVAFVIATVLMLFVSGIKREYIIAGILLVLIALPLLYFFVLPEHAKTRIDVFLNPNLDPRGSGYNVIQSKLAIGSGRILGNGLIKGKSNTIRIFISKNYGLHICCDRRRNGIHNRATVIITYVILITKSNIYCKNSKKDSLRAYISMGIAGIFIFHMTENIGMAMGLLQ